MPFTVPDAIPFETLTDGEPTRTLNGGSNDESPILAEVVQDVITDLRTELQAATDLLAAVPHVIDKGEISSPTTSTGITISVPSGEYGALRLLLRGSVDTAGLISLRINSLSTSIYRFGRIMRGANSGGVTDTRSAGAGVSAWELGEWNTLSGCSAVVDILYTDESSFMAFHSKCSAISTTTGSDNMRETTAWGSLNSSVLLTSIQVRTAPAVNGYTSLRWWLTGIPS
jgi:hypothetical protein